MDFIERGQTHHCPALSIIFIPLPPEDNVVARLVHQAALNLHRRVQLCHAIRKGKISVALCELRANGDSERMLLMGWAQVCLAPSLQLSFHDIYRRHT